MKKPLLTILLSLIFIATSCTWSTPPKKKKKISLPIAVELYSLDPRKVSERSSTQIINMLFEGLIRYDEQGNLSLGLAESFTIDKKQTTYTFTLRDAMWSNGEKITAHDIEYAWKGALHTKLFSSNTSLLYFIKNARKYVHGACELKDIGVHALDEKTLLVQLENPTPFFLELLTLSIFKPIPREIDEIHPGWDSQITHAFRCSGPFRVCFHKRGIELLLEKNPYYWDEKVVSLDQIEIAYVPDSQTRAFLFKKKELDWYGQPLCTFDSESYDTIDRPEPIHFKPVYASFWLQVNTEDPILSNKNMRKALSYAINRQEITDYVLQKQETPSYTFLPQVFNLEKKYTLEGKTKLDAQAAFTKGLEELGIEKADFPKITLGYACIGDNKRVAEVLQTQIKETLDIDICLEQREWKVLLDSITRGNFQLAEMGWFSSYPDPTYFLSLFETKEGKDNYSRWSHDEYTMLISKLKKTKNNRKRMKLIIQLDQIISEEHPIIPVYNFSCLYATSGRLKNVVLSEMGIADFKYATLEEETPSKI